jgi:hypothetical protein
MDSRPITIIGTRPVPMCYRFGTQLVHAEVSVEPIDHYLASIPNRLGRFPRFGASFYCYMVK